MKNLNSVLNVPVQAEKNLSRVRRSPVLVSLGLAAIVAITNQSAPAATLVVPGDANIFGAGHSVAPNPGGAGGGELPPVFSFPASANQVLVFSSITGTVRIDDNEHPWFFNGAEGGYLFARTDVYSYGGIAGIVDLQKTMFLVGVFLDDTEPADPAPNRLNFSWDALTENFEVLAPALRQVFFVGNGVNEDRAGAAQQFFVPNGATRLFLGFADSWDDVSYSITGYPGWYDDNDGFLTANFIIAPAATPSIAGQPSNCTNNVGTRAAFSVAAGGTLPLQYQWRKAGLNLNDGGNVFGATTATLFLYDVQSSDAGDYSVLVSNAHGSVVSSNAYLTVLPPVARTLSFTTLKSFGILSNISGVNPSCLVQGSDGTLYGATGDGEGAVGGTIFKLAPDGSNFTVLKWFTNQIEGKLPIDLIISDHVLYGTTQTGGSESLGTVFKLNNDGTGFTVLREFIENDGWRPAGLTLSGSILYGTAWGGRTGQGTVFKLNTDGTGFMLLKIFNGYDGNLPNGLTLSGDILYGTTRYGGVLAGGTVFKINTDGTDFEVLKRFDFSLNEGVFPVGGLAVLDGLLYGTTTTGGSMRGGTVFKLNKDGTGYTLLKEFNPDSSDGVEPMSDLVLSGSTLYGTTTTGGGADGFGYGTVFKINTDGTDYTVLKTFVNASSDGIRPEGALVLSDTNLYGMTILGGAGSSGTVFKANTDGTGYSVLKNFTAYRNDALCPNEALTVSAHVLYGTTGVGGSSGLGTVIKLNTDGTGYTLLKEFGSDDGGGPLSRLTLSGSVLYGSTGQGGYAGCGTLFKIRTDGTDYTLLKEFNFIEGRYPSGGLTLSGDVLYGTAEVGGNPDLGMVFAIKTDGTGYTVLNESDAYPNGNLTLSGNTLYGTTERGGSWGIGTLIKLNTDGTDFMVLKEFNGNEPGAGAYPAGGLTLISNVLYGTTRYGGTLGYGTVFRINTDGTGYTVLTEFNHVDGAYPRAGLTLSGNVLYGTTEGGGRSDLGTVFAVNIDGTGYTVLKQFNGSDGAYPQAGVTYSGNALYGTTTAGGALNFGTVFKLQLIAPLQADAGASQKLRISANGTNATVVLDGSRSSDPDGDALQYFWFESGSATPLANGVVAVIVLPVGSHSIQLVVSDGTSSNSNSITVEVVTAADAVNRLTDALDADVSRARPLAATLTAALASIDRGNPVPALNQLLAFQNKVRAQIEPLDPDLGKSLLQAAQQIVDALAGDHASAGRSRGRFTSVSRQAKGHVRMKFSGTTGATYIIEASTNLRDWEKIGVASALPRDAEFEFEDAQTGRFAQRFYRIVEP